MKVHIQGRRSVTGEPIWIRTEAERTDCTWAVTADGKRFPAQPRGEGVLVVADLTQGQNVEAELVSEPAPNGVEVRLAPDEKALDIFIGGKLFTSYVFDRGYLKPYLGPVYTAEGTTYTRLNLETREHPHQRSVFLAVGDVNGVDFWNENAETRGEERHQAIERMISGPAWGGFTAKNVWCNHQGVPMLDEKRTFTFYHQPESCRYVDVEVAFTASYGDVRFGQTKEAGPLGIRVNEEMRADRTGGFVNAYGARNEAE